MLQTTSRGAFVLANSHCLDHQHAGHHILMHGASPMPCPSYFATYFPLVVSLDWEQRGVAGLG